jgi:hypothetical protein
MSNSKTKKGENENIYTKQQHEEQEENGVVAILFEKE